MDYPKSSYPICLSQDVEIEFIGIPSKEALNPSIISPEHLL
jgi:hypothetical protein